MQVHELRLTRRLLNYWQRLRKKKARTCPDIAFFNTAALEDVWPYCVQLGIESRAGTYKYEYMGDGIKRIYGEDLTGNVVDAGSAGKKFPGEKIFKKMGGMADGIPVEDEGHFLKADGSVVKYRACLLPFGNKSNNVSHIIIGFSCRDFR